MQNESLDFEDNYKIIFALDSIKLFHNDQFIFEAQADLRRIVNDLLAKEGEKQMIQFSIGDQVIALVKKVGGAYEPNCSINAGEKTTICAIHHGSCDGPDIYCDEYNGFVFKPEELKLVVGKPAIIGEFCDDEFECRCGAILQKEQKFCAECGLEQYWGFLKLQEAKNLAAPTYTANDLEVLYGTEYDGGDHPMDFIQWLRERTAE